MLGTDLKPAAHFKDVQTYLKPSGRFRSRPDELRVVQTASKPSVRTNVVTKLSSNRLLNRHCPWSTVRSVICLPAIKEGGATNTTQASLILPLLPAVSRRLEERFSTARKRSRSVEPYARRLALLIGLHPLHDRQCGSG